MQTHRSGGSNRRGTRSPTSRDFGAIRFADSDGRYNGMEETVAGKQFEMVVTANIRSKQSAEADSTLCKKLYKIG